MGNVLDYMLESVTQIAAAHFVEAGGICVTVEVCARRQVVIIRDVVGMEPVNEFLLNGFAFRVIAYHAFACVTYKGGL